MNCLSIKFLITLCYYGNGIVHKNLKQNEIISLKKQLIKITFNAIDSTNETEKALSGLKK